MMRQIILESLKRQIPSQHWRSFWYASLTVAIAVLPVGLLLLQGLSYFGFEAAPRMTQLLMVFSVIGGAGAGFLALWLVNSAGFPSNSIIFIKWLARIAVVFPLLFLLSLFLLFSK